MFFFRPLYLPLKPSHIQHKKRQSVSKKVCKDFARDCKNGGISFTSGNFPQHLEISDIGGKSSDEAILSPTDYCPCLDKEDGQIVETLIVPNRRSSFQDTSPTSLPSESDKDSGYSSKFSAREEPDKVENDTDISEFSDDDLERRVEQETEVRSRTPFQRKVWNRRNGRYRVRQGENTYSQDYLSPSPTREISTQSSIHDQLINLKAEIAAMKQEIAEMNEETETDTEEEENDLEEKEGISKRNFEESLEGELSYLSDYSVSEYDYLDYSDEQEELSDEEEEEEE